MKLAERDDYELPHIDWVSSGSETVYRSRGKPDTDFDPDANHAVSWYPNDDQIEEYIDVLESLEVGDALVMCANGPAPLKGTVVETGDNYVICDEATGGSPPRRIQWDADAASIGQKKADGTFGVPRDVYHIEEYNGQFVDEAVETDDRDEDRTHAIASAIDTLSVLQKDWDSLSEDEKYEMVSEAKTELLDQQ